MPDLSIEEGRRLLAEATPGPWEVRASGKVYGPSAYPICEGFPMLNPRDTTNAALIVFLRNHAEALLEAAERAEAAERQREAAIEYGADQEFEKLQAEAALAEAAEQNQRYMLTPAEAFYAQGAMEMVGPDGTKDGLALWESALAKLTARAGNVR